MAFSLRFDDALRILVDAYSAAAGALGGSDDDPSVPATQIIDEIILADGRQIDHGLHDRVRRRDEGCVKLRTRQGGCVVIGWIGRAIERLSDTDGCQHRGADQGQQEQQLFSVAATGRRSGCRSHVEESGGW